LPSLNFLIKPASSSCNLKCNYCFYRSEVEKRDVACYGNMQDETLEIIVAKGLQYADKVCEFAFQGGEPTLIGLDFYKKLIKFEKKYNLKKVRIINTIQTNGTLIDEEWAGFLRENGFLVGVSLDGPKEVHDLNRIDSRKDGTFNPIMKTLRLFDRYGVEFNILAVITSNSSRYADKIYNFFKKSGFGYLQFIPCLAPFGSRSGDFIYSPDQGKLELFLKRLFDNWYSDLMNGKYISIRYFDNLVRMIKGGEPEACGMGGICRCNCVIEADGGVYPCDFYAIDKWKLGNIRDLSIEEMIQSDVARKFVEISKPIHETCKSCKWLNICRGGCRREREMSSDIQLNCFCNDYKNFFEYAYTRLVEVANFANAF
jgi:uncharacterized protein